MNRIATFAGIVGTALCLYLPASSAQAQATRTWVSGVGDDVNPCSRTAPCKTFAGAISKTAAAGEINCLDPGGFGAVTITKSISIDCSEVFASVLVSGTNGIVISGAGIKVVLRNLDIQGIGTGINGVSVLAAAEVIIDHCRIAEFTSAAIRVAGGSDMLGQILDTTIIQVPSGIVVGTSSGTANFSVKNARIDNTSSAAVQTVAGGNVSVVESLITNASGSALVSGAAMYVAGSMIDKTGVAFNAGAGATMFVSNNDVTNTGVAFLTTGTISSAGNNRIASGSGAPNGAAISIK
jgi:hypothetical protein